MNILAVIPARGGSKGIPKKNLKKINNKSLVYRAVEFSKRISWISKVVCSSDDQNILNEAKKAGADIPFVRPPELSGDFIGDIEVLKNALIESEKFYKKEFDFVCMVQPTCPTRLLSEANNCFERITKSKFDLVLTVDNISSKYHPLKQIIIEEDFNSRLFLEEGKKIIARQQLKNTYCRNGSFYIAKKSHIINSDNIMNCKFASLVSTINHVNIDTLEDLELAKKLIID